MEFEFSYQGQVVKTFQEAAPDGPTVGIAVPHYRLAGGKQPDDTEFLAELSGLSDYARRRAGHVESLPWHDWPLPKKFMIVSDVSGYGDGRLRRPLLEQGHHRGRMPQSLRQMGVNSLRAAPAFLHEMAREARRASPRTWAWARSATPWACRWSSYRKDRDARRSRGRLPFRLAGRAS